jgi:hypothetical protein
VEANVVCWKVAKEKKHDFFNSDPSVFVECKSNKKKGSLFSSDPTIITGMQKQSEKVKLKSNQNLGV